MLNLYNIWEHAERYFQTKAYLEQKEEAWLENEIHSIRDKNMNGEAEEHLFNLWLLSKMRKA